MTIQEIDPSTRFFHGVSLSQYASVQAGLSENFELDAVLAHEAIDPAAWPEAEDAWSDALLEGLERENGVHEAFDEHLAAAQDRFGRRVPPIDEDLTAWLDFVRHWSAAPEPVALLDRLGLGPPDVVRLHRGWSRRLALDPALAQQALGILGHEPGALPVVRPEPRALKRPDPPRTAPQERLPPADIEAPRGDDKEPRVFVDLAGWLSRGGAAEDATGIEAGTRALSSAHVGPLSIAEDTLPPTLSPIRRGPVLPFAEVMAPRIQSMGDAAAIPAISAESGIPFVGTHVPPGPPALSGALVGPPSDGEETLPPTLSPVRRGPALPFLADPAPGIHTMGDPLAIPATGAPGSPPPAPRGIARPKSDLGATTDFPSGLLAAALPFMKQHGPAMTPAKIESAAAPSAQTTEATLPRGIMRPTRDLGSTGVLPAGLLAAALPFMKEDGLAAPPQNPVASSPRGIARPSHDLGSTGVLPAGLLAAALPFMKSTPPPVMHPREGRQPPPAPVTPTPAAVVPPIDARSQPPLPSPTVGPMPPRLDTTLTLAQYAALCAELIVFPAASEQTFERYGLATASQRTSIDRAWKARLQSNALEHQEWQQLYQRYKTALSERTQRGNPKQ